MDPTTAYVIAALMMLLNGGVLGLMHGDLPRALRPAATYWRVGTLLMACGCLALAAQPWAPIAWVLPLGNGMIAVGGVAYVQGLRRFYGRADLRALWWLPPLCVAAVWWWSAVSPSLAGRAGSISLVLGGLMALGAWVLWREGARERAKSRAVLLALFAGIGLFFLVRGIAFASGEGVPDSILDADHWMNVVTPMLAAVMPVIGTTAFLLLCSDRLRRDLEYAATTDHLTGLANRRTLAEAGARAVRVAQKGSARLGLAVIDIDHFKRINDQHGHEIGDLALRHVADRLREACRAEDVPCRQGGEEFVALLGGSDLADAERAAERLRIAIAAAPFVHGDRVLPITVSIGVSAFEPGDRGLDDLLRRADQALYAAKAAGRNRVVVAPLVPTPSTPVPVA